MVFHIEMLISSQSLNMLSCYRLLCANAHIETELFTAIYHSVAAVLDL